MITAYKHLAISARLRTRYTPQGNYTEKRGLDAKTFYASSSRGELFLLTSFFIEPNVHGSGESVRGPSPKASEPSRCRECATRIG
jgi:hypothetical protein